MIYIDAHVHARAPGTPEFKQSVPVYTAHSAAVYMMNLPDPLDISDAGRAVAEVWDYHRAIMDVADAVGHGGHKALCMSVMADAWTDKQLRDFIKAAEKDKLPLAGFKLFSPGQSTNSGYAPSSVERAIPLIDVAAENGVPVAFHLEDPDEPDAAKKEASAMMNILPDLLSRGRGKNKKRLEGKFSIEHISTKIGLIIARQFGVNYTITPHHLKWSRSLLNLGNFISSETEKQLRAGAPYYLCKPLIGDGVDMDALRAAWKKDRDPRLMIGSDSAPHTRAKKEHPDPEKRAAGIFMGDSRLGYGAALENDMDGKAVGELLEYYSLNAANFYGIDINSLRPAMPAYEPDLSGFDEADRVINILKMKGKIDSNSL